MIDTKNIKSDVFNVHNNENKIVDNKAINNNQLLQFRIEVLNNNYRYLLLLADKNQREFKTILQKGDLSSGESLNDDTDIIECYSACDDIIYTYETSVNSDEYYLCTYDLNGKRLTKERMYTLENIEDMKDYMMWDMEVIGNDMIYFDSLSNRRITAEKSENGFKVIDELNNLRLLKDSKCVDKENRRFYYFYENYDDKFYRFDKDTKEIDIIDVSGYKISNCTLDGDRIIFSNDNDKSNLEYYEVVFDE